MTTIIALITLLLPPAMVRTMMCIEGVTRRPDWGYLQLCLSIYHWEEETGVQHTYTLEEVSQAFNIRIEEVRLLYDIVSYKDDL